MSIAEKITRAKADYDEVYEAGKAQRDYEWWAKFQDNGNRTAWIYGFAGVAWEDDCYNPKFPIKAYGNANYMFYYSRISSTKVGIDADTTNFSHVFSNMTNLTTIPLLKVSIATSLNNCFTNDDKLANITIEGTIARSVNTQWCPLTKESILSVLDAMTVPVSGQTATFNETAVNAAFTTEEWEALIAPKRSLGWSIALATA